MRRLGVAIAIAISTSAAAMAVSVGTASADPNSGPQICPGTEVAIAGTRTSLTIRGNRYVAAGTTLNVTQNLTIAPGACLDAFTLGTVDVGGNVTVDSGAIFALGCSTRWNSGGTGPPCNDSTTDDVVTGNLTAIGALTMYLDADTIKGNLLSIGGGPGTTLSPYITFPIKDNTIDGSATISGWHGAWFGFLRNTVGRNVLIDLIVDADSDSTEVATNMITGSLGCFGNNPAPQFGDSSGSPSIVGGFKLWQCSGL
jgi:hypothetical protein